MTFHPCYLGGGFGRRSMSDYVVEAVHLSRAVRRPVKLIWTREDDVQYGAFRPQSLQRMTGGVDADGDLTAWTHCVVGDGGGLLSSGIGIPHYDIPNQRIESRGVRHGVRTKHWRSVGHGPQQVRHRGLHRRRRPRRIHRPLPVPAHAPAGRAARRGRPRRGRRDGRLGRESAERTRAGGSPSRNEAGSLAAGVAEISVDETSGRIRVHRFWCAVDGGIIVQPDNARAQLEGGIVTGLSSALFERVTVRDGRVEQSNYHDYSILRMSDMPEIDVRFIPSHEPPMGLGESGTPLGAARGRERLRGPDGTAASAHAVFPGARAGGAGGVSGP